MLWPCAGPMMACGTGICDGADSLFGAVEGNAGLHGKPGEQFLNEWFSRVHAEDLESLQAAIAAIVMA